MMLQAALTARLPVLRATTSDIVNLAEVLEHLVPKLAIANYTKSMMKGDVFIAIEEVKVTPTIYEQMVENGKTLLLINQDDDSGLSLNVGEVPVPLDLMVSLIEEVAQKKRVRELLPAFRGLTLKSASEVIRLATTIHKELTVESVLRERSHITGKLKGLTLVDTDTMCYVPNKLLVDWVKIEKPYFFGADDARLIPRGLLFDGEPGVGKTQGAKYIAREFGVPLYRLDLASSMTKWMGESEANFSRVLSALDQEEPCVFLIDEVEKLFDGGEDSGTTARILSQLLWWLQEHQTRIITIMTTNDFKSLPPELYRSGRIDGRMVFNPMPVKEAWQLAAAICSSLEVGLTQPLKSAITKVSDKTGGITPAVVTQMVYSHIKTKGDCLN